ncbi:hypothetical protein [Trichormus variabilis]|uniref:hypothetical protein n=1 Tax=Anabaena variabilis TaxID=264691 RepID=UPI0013153AF5|nr:hypothetical protein [Trichormus variabilis]MBD2626480.1 hypothetical protein [Trichormus variabilis FACHB-164]
MLSNYANTNWKRSPYLTNGDRSFDTVTQRRWKLGKRLNINTDTPIVKLSIQSMTNN